MKLEWESFVGPTTEKAVGFAGVFVVFHKPDGSIAYFFRHGIPLCPINKDRASLRTECASPKLAREQAQEWEDNVVLNANEILDAMDKIGRLQE